MKRILTICLLTFSILTHGQTSVEIAKKAIKSTVSIIALDKSSQPLGTGSGFIIDDELIVTNVHVIAGCNSAFVLSNGEEKKYQVAGYVAIDSDNDLVILKVTGLFGSKLSIGTETQPDIGEKIYAVGNPRGFNGTFSEGIISGIRNFSENSVLQITAPISPGSSGGAVLNSNGDVIGIAFASFTEGQNLNYAIPVRYLIELKKTVGLIKELSSILPPVKTKKQNSITPNISEGLQIRNVKSCCGVMPNMISFSVKNDLGVTVSDIRILFLIFDATGVAVDSYEGVFFKKNCFKDNCGIKPYLARSVSFENSIEEKAPQVNFPSGFKIKSRILDFNIVE